MRPSDRTSLAQGNGCAQYIGYTRVSLAEQVDAYGLDAQERAIRQEAARRGWDLIGIVREEGASGKDLRRPQLQGTLQRIAMREASGIIVARLDRLTRSVADFGMLLEWSSEADAALVALDFDLNSKSANGRLVASIIVAVAEWERHVIAARTRDGLAAARAQGRAISRPTVNPELALRIHALRASGWTLQAICDFLNGEGIATPRGGSCWRPSSVRAAAGYRRPPTRRRSVDLPTVNRRRQGP